MSHAKGNKKHADRCKNYENLGTRETNKKKKIIRHLKNQPNDKQANKVLDKL